MRKRSQTMCWAFKMIRHNGIAFYDMANTLVSMHDYDRAIEARVAVLSRGWANRRRRPPMRTKTMPTVDQVIVWVVVGLLGGGIASLVVTWNRAGVARGVRKRWIEHRCILNRGDPEPIAVAVHHLQRSARLRGLGRSISRGESFGAAAGASDGGSGGGMRGGGFASAD
jgi:hypothetical protein